MKLKLLKYQHDIPLLYSFAFVLGPRAKLRGLFNVMQILKENTGVDYSSYYADVKTKIYKLFNKNGPVRLAEKTSQNTVLAKLL